MTGESDVSPGDDRMVASAGRQERVEAKVEFRLADVLDLPFEAGRFDVVICESVLIFIEDKARAIQECVRVTQPGGYVGLNEGVWLSCPKCSGYLAYTDRQ
jgi:ubiquinone/menaquinone biosynthesis C-methylase UbiE